MGHKPPGKGKNRSKLPRVLNDHVRDGKKFRPKLLDYMLKSGQGPPTLEWVRWALPEVLWIKLLVHEYGIRHVSTLTGSESTDSAAVKEWYEEANEAKGWGFYAPSEENLTEEPADNDADAQTPNSSASPEAEDD